MKKPKRANEVSFVWGMTEPAPKGYALKAILANGLTLTHYIDDPEDATECYWRLWHYEDVFLSEFKTLPRHIATRGPKGNTVEFPQLGLEQWLTLPSYGLALDSLTAALLMSELESKFIAGSEIVRRYADANTPWERLRLTLLIDRHFRSEKELSSVTA